MIDTIMWRVGMLRRNNWTVYFYLQKIHYFHMCFIFFRVTLELLFKLIFLHKLLEKCFYLLKVLLEKEYVPLNMRTNSFVIAEICYIKLYEFDENKF